ncbi:sugar kinase [Amycolatopsis pigmentata]|uniref:Sugar kinase n=1 Tax=Amycolatopsis pigmentata TaxID=450801 RepID=A0ABW5FZ49_9PSEU
MSHYDVLLLGEPLVEISTLAPFRAGVAARIGISGDVVNAAAAAVAAGASVGLIARITEDELGEAVAAYIRELGVDDALLRRVPGQQGIYLQHGDPEGERQFCYARTGSVGAALCPADLDPALLGSAGAVLASGITCAISATAKAAVREAARLSKRFVYDPNFRPRLGTAEDAAETLATLAPMATLVTPSAPGEIAMLLGTADPVVAVAKLRERGADAVAVTRGSAGVYLGDSTGSREYPAIPAPEVVDQTGAGDVFAGTVTARLALGDPLDEAVLLGAAAASLSVGGRGGTGRIASLPEVIAHAGFAR